MKRALQLDLLRLLPPELIGDTSDRSRAGIRLKLRPPPEPPPLPDRPDDALRSLEYAIVDVETTGGSPLRGHRITEFAAVRMRGTGEIVAEYTTLVNPLRPIPPLVTALTRITPAMLAAAPVFADIVRPVVRILDGAVFVAHNAGFDHRFVNVELERAGAPHLRGRTLCTVRLARRTVPEVTHRSLDALSYFFGVENEARHRAYGDARATAVIFRRLLARVEEYEVARWLELEKLLRRRPRKPRKRIANPHCMEGA